MIKIDPYDPRIPWMAAAFLAGILASKLRRRWAS
jgi:hypothetical protein